MGDEKVTAAEIIAAVLGGTYRDPREMSRRGSVQDGRRTAVTCLAELSAAWPLASGLSSQLSASTADWPEKPTCPPPARASVSLFPSPFRLLPVSSPHLLCSLPSLCSGEDWSSFTGRGGPKAAQRALRGVCLPVDLHLSSAGAPSGADCS